MARQPQPPTPLDAARRSVIEMSPPLPVEEVAASQARGRYLAEDLVSQTRLQPFDNSAMDGYALRSTAIRSATADEPVLLEVVDESRAGLPAGKGVGDGEAIVISTGAKMPAGADAVVPVEDSERREGQVSLSAPTSPGANVRKAGEDVEIGQTVLRAGDRIGPGELALIAALGVEQVRCRRRPTVAMISSGDELTPPGVPLGDGAIRDASSPMLSALIPLYGGETHSSTHTGDDLESTVAAVKDAMAADVVIVCGGISVGPHDHVKAAFERSGVVQKFWRIGLKPGGPMFFGHRDSTLVFGLPGNPVSVFATFTLLVAPALVALGGGPTEARRGRAILAADYEKRTDRAEAIRCRLELTNSGWVAHAQPRQGSHVITSIVGADCLAIIPPEMMRVERGQELEIELLPR